MTMKIMDIHSMFFSAFSSVFSISSHVFNSDNAQSSSSSRSLTDKILKEDNVRVDDNLDSLIEQHGHRGALPSTFSNSSTRTTLHRETKLQQSLSSILNHIELCRLFQCCTSSGSAYYASVHTVSEICRTSFVE